MKPVISETYLLASVMVVQSIIQAANSSTETFDGTKSKYDSCIASVENTTQISGHNILYIASPKMVGWPLTSACRLKGHLPCLTWSNLKNELLRQYSKIPYEIYATQAVAHLQQASDAILEMYLHHASKLLSKIRHTTDMSQNLTEGLDH